MGVNIAKGRLSERVLPGVAAFAANTTIPFPMQTNSVVEEVHFKLTGQLTLAGYTANPTIRKDGLESLIRGSSFVGNSKTSGNPVSRYCTADARSLRLKTAIVEGVWPDRVDVGNANGTYQFETNFTKYFRAKRVKLPNGNDVTDLDTRKLQSLVVNIDWRDVNALVVPNTGTGGTATLANVQVVISVTERYVNGMQKDAPYIKETLRSIPLAPLGSGINVDIPNIPLSNFLIRQYLMTGASDVAYGDLNDTIISTTLKPEGSHVQTSVTGQGGAVTRFDVQYQTQQTQNRHAYGLPTWPDGTVILEYAPTGLPKDILDLRTTAPTSILSAKNILDLTLVANQLNTLWILDEELVPNN